MGGVRRVLAAAAMLAATGATTPVARPGVAVEITSRRDAYGGRPFGQAGTYEVLTGVAHMTIDPRATANRGIVDLDHAGRDADGLVHYDVDLQILRPRRTDGARRVMLYEVVNRGMRLAASLNGGSIADVDPFAKPGNGFLMRQGYTVVWSGWQGDVAGKGLIGARLPMATDGGRPITGPVSTETIFDNASGTIMTLPYPAASLDQPAARLTVRQRADDPERPVAAADWRITDDRHVTLKRAADMDAGAIYRFTYTARDPIVMGLGFAAVRDMVAFLRHGSAADGNPLADMAAAPCERDARGGCVATGGGAFDVTVGFGLSQSGRYLRDYLWQGFNRDTAGRRVFDAMLPMIPGARRTYTNLRFAEPGRFSRQHEDHDVPGFDFPFTYATLRDPLSGRTDGLMRRCAADGTCPKLFHVDTGGEFWQAGASLVGTGGTRRDVALPAIVRAFAIAGGAHAPGLAPPMCANPANPFNYSALTRALIVDLVDWASGRRPPPASVWPKVAELREVAALSPPDLRAAGVEWPAVVNRPTPATGGRGWPVLVPAVDADGIDRGGVRLPEIAVPTGTYLGWNLRRPGHAPGELCLVFGSYKAFARDPAGRGADTRPSLAERYPAGTLAKRSAAAAAELVRARLMLEEDAIDAVPPPAPIL